MIENPNTTIITFQEYLQQLNENLTILNKRIRQQEKASADNQKQGTQIDYITLGNETNEPIRDIFALHNIVFYHPLI